MLIKKQNIYNTSVDVNKKKAMFSEKHSTKSPKSNDYANNQTQDLTNAFLPTFSINIRDFASNLDFLLENYSIKMVIS